MIAPATSTGGHILTCGGDVEIRPGSLSWSARHSLLTWLACRLVLVTSLTATALAVGEVLR